MKKLVRELIDFGITVFWALVIYLGLGVVGMFIGCLDWQIREKKGGYLWIRSLS